MRVFITAPPLCQTGGVELLHQFSQCLSARNIENYIFYPDLATLNCPTPEAYFKYGAKYVTQYVDAHDSILVVPEIFIHLTDICKKGKILIWWLSIDNYLKKYATILHANENDPFLLRRRKNIFHAVQSMYAKEYIKNAFGISESHILSDYINDDIANIARLFSDKFPRENFCLYNPRKGLQNLQPLIQKTRKDITWIPLQNLTSLELGTLMCKSKVYIDFGNHPGKDRIPREAAICGCCVITNKEGSAAYHEDVAIPDKYKIMDMQDLDNTLSLIYECIDNYEDVRNDFHEYRQIISNEKTTFIAEIDRIFDVLKHAIASDADKDFDSCAHAELMNTFLEISDNAASLLRRAQEAADNADKSDFINQLLDASYTLRIMQEGIATTLDNISSN